MNKRELVEIVVNQSKLTPLIAERVIDSMLGAIKRELRFQRRVKIEKFGIFHVIVTQALSGRNPRTGTAILIKSKKKPVFLPSRLFRVEINTVI